MASVLQESKNFTLSSGKVVTLQTLTIIQRNRIDELQGKALGEMKVSLDKEGNQTGMTASQDMKKVQESQHELVKASLVAINGDEVPEASKQTLHSLGTLLTGRDYSQVVKLATRYNSETEDDIDAIFAGAAGKP